MDDAISRELSTKRGNTSNPSVPFRDACVTVLQALELDKAYEAERKSEGSVLNTCQLTAKEALDFGLTKIAEEPSCDPGLYRRFWQGMLEYADQLAAEKRRVTADSEKSDLVSWCCEKLAVIDEQLCVLRTWLAASPAPVNQAQEHAVRALADKVVRHLIVALADGQMSIFVRRADETDTELYAEDFQLRLRSFSPVCSHAEIGHPDRALVGEIRVDAEELHSWLSEFLVPISGAKSGKAGEAGVVSFYLSYLRQNSDLQPIQRETFEFGAKRLAPRMSDRGIDRAWKKVREHFPNLKKRGRNRVRTEHQEKHRRRIVDQLRDLGL